VRVKPKTIITAVRAAIKTCTALFIISITLLFYLGFKCFTF